MKKNLILIAISLLFASNIAGQNLTTMKEYYDYLRTRIKRVYTVLPNDKKHGIEKCYLEDGRHYCTNTYQFGERCAVKIFFTDGSIKMDAKIAPKGSVDESLCTDYTLYTISNSGQRILGMKSKLHQAQPFDDIGDFSYTLAMDRWFMTLNDYRIESYMQNYLDGKPCVRFSTSADKRTEHLITYDEDGKVSADISYNIKTETLHVNRLHNENYSVENGIITFAEDNDIIIEKENGFEYRIDHGSQIDIKTDIKISRKDYYKKLTDCTKDDDTGEFVIIVSKNAFGDIFNKDFISANVDVAQLTFLGRRLKWDTNLYNIDVLMSPCELGNTGDGDYISENPDWMVEATYNNGELSYLNIIHAENFIKGEIKDGLLNGTGEYTLGDKYYKGEFKDNKRDGTGYFKTQEFTYNGGFKNDDITGEGVKTYDVEVHNSVGNLYRVSVKDEGFFYGNTFSNGVRTMTFPNWNIEYKLAAEELIEGRITWDNGDYYEGDDLRFFNGEGKMYYANGDYFEGYINDIGNANNPHSNNTANLSNGDDYKRPAFERFEKGEIRITLKYGIIYEGNYNRGFSGAGKLILTNGDELRGEFVENQINYLLPINVKLNLPTGELFEGTYVAGKFNGQGKLTTKKGEVYEGIWKSGKFANNPKIKLPIKKLSIPTIEFNPKDY